MKNLINFFPLFYIIIMDWLHITDKIKVYLIDFNKRYNIKYLGALFHESSPAYSVPHLPICKYNKI